MSVLATRTTAMTEKKPPDFFACLPPEYKPMAVRIHGLFIDRMPDARPLVMRLMVWIEHHDLQARDLNEVLSKVSAPAFMRIKDYGVAQFQERIAEVVAEVIAYRHDEPNRKAAEEKARAAEEARRRVFAEAEFYKTPEGRRQAEENAGAVRQIIASYTTTTHMPKG